METRQLDACGRLGSRPQTNYKIFLDNFPLGKNRCSTAPRRSFKETAPAGPALGLGASGAAWRKRHENYAFLVLKCLIITRR